MSNGTLVVPKYLWEKKVQTLRILYKCDKSSVMQNDYLKYMYSV